MRRFVRAAAAATLAGTALVIGTAVMAGPSPAPDFTSARISLSVASGPPNTYVAISGKGFPPNELVEIYLDTPDAHLGYPGPHSDTQGNFKESDVIPGTTVGRHQICADTYFPSPQAHNAKACAAFAVVALAASSTRPPNTSTNLTRGLPLPAALAVLGLLAIFAVGLVLGRRRPG